MGLPSPSDARTDSHDHAVEHTRRLVLETIAALPPNPGLLHDLLTMIRFLAERPRRPRHFGTAPDGQSRACLWVAHVGSWLLWLW